MAIVKKLLNPSREDAVRLTRNEKIAMLFLMHAATTLTDLAKEIPDRIGMVDGGAERLKRLTEETDRLLDDLRVTIPENQRFSLEHTGNDYEMRLTPKGTPQKTTVVMEKEEFRKLVDYARTKCRECADDEEECKACGLYSLLTSVLPMDDYSCMNLCPYNLGEWVN